MSGDTEKRRSLINDTIIIAAITFLGYFLSFNYEVGHKKFFHLPDSFIEIDITSVIKTVGVLFTYLFLIYQIVNVIFHFYPLNNSPISRSIKKLIWLFLILFSLAYASGFDKVSLILCSLIFIILAILEVGLPLLLRGNQSYSEKLEKTQENNTSPFVVFLVNKGTNYYYLLSFFILMVFGSSFMTILGEHDASKEAEYLLILSKPTLLVVDSYKDAFIVAPINIETKTVTTDFQLISTKKASNDSIKFQSVTIKGLKVDKVKTITEETYKK